MALEYNNKTYRNLQEQVYKNMQDISNIVSEELTLANFGIYVKGIVPEDFEIPYIEDPNSYIEDGGSSGDAYLVGTVEPYNLYIYTRVSDISYEWLNIGEFPKAGPIGPQGIQGIQGPIGNQRPWCISTTQLPTINILADPSALVEGDICLVVGSFDENEINYDIGDILVYDGGQWAKLENIRGPRGSVGSQGPIGPIGLTGPQGPKGETGDTGTIMKIMGKWDYQISDLVNHPLPDPAVLRDPTYAYLVPEDLSVDPVIYDLFIQIGATPETRYWTNNGPITGGTDVYVGLQFQKSYNMNKKLDKLENITTYTQAYCKKGNGHQDMLNIEQSPVISSIPFRTTTGQIKATNPVEANDCVTKDYLIKMTSNITPAEANTLAIGNSSNYYKYGYISNIYANNLSTVSGANITTWKNIIPNANYTCDLGSSDKLFCNAYIDNLVVNSINGPDGDLFKIASPVFLQESMQIGDNVSIGDSDFGLTNLYAQHIYSNGVELTPGGGMINDVLYSGWTAVAMGCGCEPDLEHTIDTYKYVVVSIQLEEEVSIISILLSVEQLCDLGFETYGYENGKLIRFTRTSEDTLVIMNEMSMLTNDIIVTRIEGIK